MRCERKPRNGYLEISLQIEYNGEKIICRVFAAWHSERGREQRDEGDIKEN